MEINNSMRLKMGDSFVWVHTDRSSISKYAIKEATAAANQALQGELFLRHKGGKTEYSTDKKKWTKVEIKNANSMDSALLHK